MLNPGLPFTHICTGVFGTKLARIGQCGCDEGTFGACQLARGLAKVVLGTRIQTIDGAAHLYGVEVDLHNALLAPQQFYQSREIDLETFSHPASSRP